MTQNQAQEGHGPNKTHQNPIQAAQLSHPVIVPSVPALGQPALPLQLSNFPQLMPRLLKMAEDELSIDLPVDTAQMLEVLVERFGLKEKHWPYYLADWPSTQALAAILSKVADIKPGHEVLDLGSGSGALSCFLSRRFSIQPIALDFNTEACALTRWNLAQHGSPNPRVICGDFTALPMQRAFDCIVGGEILYAQDLLPQVLQCLKLHLKPTGEAWLGDSRRSCAEPFTEMAQTMGFRVKCYLDALEKANVYQLHWQ